MKRMSLIFTGLTTCSLSVCLGAALHAAQPTPENSLNTSKLWIEFVEASKTGSPAALLDFSYAGYKHGEQGVPDVKYKVFNVTKFGAVPNDGKSDRQAIEKAIRAAEKNGSGVIFFPKGRYDVHSAGDPDTPITISGSKLVLRGEGSGEGGTELFMELPNPAVDTTKMWTSPDLLLFKGDGSTAKITDVTGDTPRGGFSVQVADASNLKAGDWVCLELKNNDPKLVAEELYPYSVEPDWTSIINKGVQVQDYHQITKIEGNKVWFKEPVMHKVESKWGWFIRKYPKLEGVGIEDIAFVGNFHEAYVHHKSWLHDGGYKIFNFTRVVDSWVRRCRFTDVVECGSIVSSANVSCYDCVITGNVGHSAMRSQGSSRVFLGLIDDQPSMWHSVGISKPSMGAVIWRCKWGPGTCFEAHASQPRATLFDSCQGGFMRMRAGGAISENPNHLADLFFWNFLETGTPKREFDFWATDTPYWRFLPPVFVGFHGVGTTFLQSQVLIDESHGVPVQPGSLYEAQLELRLGELPQWLRDLKAK